MKSVAELTLLDRELDFAIVMSFGEEVYGAMRGNGEISTIGELDINNVSVADADVQSSIEFGKKLEEFLEKNDLK